MDNLNHLAHDLQRLNSRLRRKLREQATAGDFTPSQINVLLHLERHADATVTELAQAEGVRSQSMGATIAPLQNAGLIQGQPDPLDGRKTRLSLTPHCRQQLQHNRAQRQHWLAQALQQKLSASEQQLLAQAIPLIQRLVED